MTKLSNGLLGLGAALIVCALALAAHNLYRSCAAAEGASYVVTVLQQTRPNPAEPSAAAVPEPEETPESQPTQAMQMPVVQVEGQNYIGRLSIPVLELELPVIEAWDYSALRLAPCRYAGCVYADDMVIAAHNYASHFGRLKELSAGDTVSFMDVEDNVFSYTVEDLELLNPYDISQMTQGDWDLTLFTCTLDSRQRVTIRCRRAP